MIEMRRILCPVDFSSFSRRALDHAVAIARWYRSTVTVLHVSTPVAVATVAPAPGVFEPLALAGLDREQVLRDMKGLIEDESAPGVPIDSLVREGNAAAEILEQAAAMQADLIVMGTHGRTGFERLLLGSVTEKVLRKARCPVLTVPRHTVDAVPAAPVVFKQILCPIDFSNCSMYALKYGVSLAQEADGHLTVVHVLTDDRQEMEDVPDMLLADGLTVARLQREREARLIQRLNEAVPETAAAYCSLDSMMRRGKPGPEILRTAAERQIDLIVMGVQGRGAADLMFFGSTTQHVIREAWCPVLTLRGA